MARTFTTQSGNIKTSGVNGTSIFVLVVGGVILYSGIKGASISNTIKGFLAGTGQPQSASDLASLNIGASNPDQSTPNVSGFGEHSGPGSQSSNVNLAKMMATPFGWGSGAEWDALYKLWTRESGFSATAKNPSSGAYGIAQALPPTKYPLAGQESGGSSASVQIAWGLAYIKARYGDPINAWAHETSQGWY